MRHKVHWNFQNLSLKIISGVNYSLLQLCTSFLHLSLWHTEQEESELCIKNVSSSPSYQKTALVVTSIFHLVFD